MLWTTTDVARLLVQLGQSSIPRGPRAAATAAPARLMAVTVLQSPPVPAALHPGTISATKTPEDTLTGVDTMTMWVTVTKDSRLAASLLLDRRPRRDHPVPFGTKVGSGFAQRRQMPGPVT